MSEIDEFNFLVGRILLIWKNELCFVVDLENLVI